MYKIQGLINEVDGFKLHIVSKECDFWIHITGTIQPFDYYVYNSHGKQDDIAKITKQITTDNNLV